jgi:hypothetical protein
MDARQYSRGDAPHEAEPPRRPIRVWGVAWTGGERVTVLGCPFCGRCHTHGGFGIRHSHCGGKVSGLYDIVDAKDMTWSDMDCRPRARSYRQKRGSRRPRKG